MIVQVQNTFTAKELEQELEEYLAKELDAFVKQALSDIDRDVPRGKTLDLAGGFKVIYDPDSLKVTIGTDIPYAPYQEFGTIENFNSNYASSEGVSNYATKFKANPKIRSSGGVFSKQFFFKNIRANFFKMINRIK